MAIGATAALAASTGAATPAWAATGDISRVAGDGTGGWVDGTATTSAKFNVPQAGAVRVVGPATTGTAYLYVADYQGHRVRVVVASGDGVVDGDTDSTESVATVAGNGQPRFSGDGGRATLASLHRPTGLAVDGAGNLFIGDQYNHRVRVVSPGADGVVDGDSDETITTVAGIMRIADTMDAPSLGDGGPATLAKLNYPTGVAVAGTHGQSNFRLYVADLSNSRVRKVDNLGVISTVAGGGTSSADHVLATPPTLPSLSPPPAAKLTGPIGVTLSGDKLFVTLQSGHKVRLVNLGVASVSANGVTVAPGNIATVAGNGTNGLSGNGGAATSAQLSSPFSTAVDGSGSLYIADETNHRIRKVTSGGTISTLAGTDNTIRSVSDGVTKGCRMEEGEITAGSTTVTSWAGAFHANDAGASISGAGIPAGTTISSVTNATTAVMSAAATLTAPVGDGDPAEFTITHSNCNVVTSATASFTASDVEAQVTGWGIPDGTKIVSVTNSTTAVLSSNATLTATGAVLSIRKYNGDNISATTANLYSPRGLVVSGLNLYIGDSENYRVRRLEL